MVNCQNIGTRLTRHMVWIRIRLFTGASCTEDGENPKKSTTGLYFSTRGANW